MSMAILSVGLDPILFQARPLHEPPTSSVDHDAIMAGANVSYTTLQSLGFTIERCLVVPGATAEVRYRHSLADQSFDFIVIGGGIRLDPTLSHMFEMLVNVGVEVQPHATFVFDTGPATKADAVLRWYQPPSFETCS